MGQSSPLTSGGRLTRKLTKWLLGSDRVAGVRLRPAAGEYGAWTLRGVRSIRLGRMARFGQGGTGFGSASYTSMSMDGPPLGATVGW